MDKIFGILNLLYKLIVRIASYFKKRPRICIRFDDRQDVAWKRVMSCKIWIKGNSEIEHNINFIGALIKECPDISSKIEYPDKNYQIPILVQPNSAEKPFEFLLQFNADIPKFIKEVTLVVNVFSYWKGQNRKSGFNELKLNV